MVIINCYMKHGMSIKGVEMNVFSPGEKKKRSFTKKA